MSGVQEQLEIKFRLHDGSDIGPKKYPAAATIATLKESILAEWPKAENENAPKTVNDVKLINAGKILENNKTLDECKSPILISLEELLLCTLLFAPYFGKRD
ncbi:membrane-anchored ubiquitin-fold protein 1-like [Iris pallida]|uniref:Membrane-anchored ubiquitin-fold protein 1-like n=1 Tax=Iris pallida TaxID=29817 RepID=A0AAX6II27_IRIPA|nr:membrane-anchored ubiquitin-fold protein 1-like [Iris pallida]